jgi:hypothetical protein
LFGFVLASRCVGCINPFTQILVLIEEQAEISERHVVFTGNVIKKRVEQLRELFSYHVVFELSVQCREIVCCYVQFIFGRWDELTIEFFKAFDQDSFWAMRHVFGSGWG